LLLVSDYMTEKQIFCKECNQELNEKDINCPNCGSKYKHIMLHFEHTIDISHQLNIKAKKEGIKKPILELVQGDDLCKITNSINYKERSIDRGNNKYLEKVINKKTGKIIYICEEPLDQHINHGSAKFKTIKKN